MIVAIQRDQAVWERETFQVDIPDGTPEDELFEAITDAVEKFNGYEAPGYSKTIIDSVLSMSTLATATLPDDTEIDL